MSNISLNGSLEDMSECSSTTQHSRSRHEEIYETLRCCAEESAFLIVMILKVILVVEFMVTVTNIYDDFIATIPNRNML